MFRTRPSSIAGNVLTTVTMLAALLAAPLASSGEQHAFTRTADADALEWGPCPAFMPEGCAIAVLQGSPAEPNADVFFKLPAGLTVPLHWHESPERMLMVSGEMEVEYEGQDPVVLTPGTYAYGPSRRPHDATCTSAEDCVLFIAFENPIDAFPAEG